MGLVDYSDSESDSESQAASTPVAAPAPKPAPSNSSSSTASKKPFHKLLDHSNPGQILVSLPASGSSKVSEDEPPAKRARTGGKSAFSGFNSFLPAPKKPAAQTKSGLRKPVGLKTSADVAFSRDGGGEGSLTGVRGSTNGGGSGPGPAIPEGQKPADEVKLVGKPLMFKPLSVARRPGQKKTTTAAKQMPSKAAMSTPLAPTATEKTTTPKPEPPPAKKPAVSLFSLEEPADEPDPEASSSTNPGGGAYEPVIATDYSSVTGPYISHSQDHSSYEQPAAAAATVSRNENPESLTSIADTMNLSAAERRELFGRSGGPSASQGLTNVVNLNMDREYAANEALRASGEVVQHNPLRSIAPGKHSLKQLVNAVQNQKEALEESFAKGKSNRKEAAGRYGWK